MKQKDLENYMPAFLENGDVECYAHPISLGTYEKMTGNLELFKRCYRNVYDGFHTSSYLYFMLSRYNESTDPNGPIYAVDKNGNLTYTSFNSVTNYLRIEIHPAYDPNSKIVKSCRDAVKVVRNDESAEGSLVSSAPAVNVGGIEYIWTNKEQCLNGTEQTMTLASDRVYDVLSKVVLSNPDVRTPQLSGLMQRECTRIALENCDEEEASLLRLGTLSRANNYKEWVENPCLERCDNDVEESDLEGDEIVG